MPAGGRKLQTRRCAVPPLPTLFERAAACVPRFAAPLATRCTPCCPRCAANVKRRRVSEPAGAAGGDERTPKRLQQHNVVFKQTRLPRGRWAARRGWRLKRRQAGRARRSP